MAWTATVYSPVPEEMRAIRGSSAPKDLPTLTVRSEGRPGMPMLYSPTTGQPLPPDHSNVIAFRDLWVTSAGPTGTGCIGQVRDMLYVLSKFCQANGKRLEVPEETQLKAQQEAEADAVSLPEEANW